jgi:hypothetical protein
MPTTQQRAYIYHTRKKQACQRKKVTVHGVLNHYNQLFL